MAATPTSSGGLAPRVPRPPLTPAVSLLVSVGVHLGLLVAMASVVWHTGVLSPDHPAAGLLSFETPSTAAPGSRGSSGERGYRPDEHGPEGGLEALLEPVLPPQNFPAAQPLRGLASGGGVELVADTPAAPASLAGSSMSGLTSGLFSSIGEGDGAAETGVSGGAVAMTAGIGEGKGSASVSFAGLGATGVGSVVYVVDVSGSMVTSLPIVVRELERSIARLAPTQKFGVVLCRRSGEAAPAAEAFAPVLVRATPSARQLLHDWLTRVEPSGRSGPLTGLEAALSLKPDAVFLLARSIQRSGGGVWEQGFESTMGRLEQLNPASGPARQRRVLIQTIQFLDEDPTGIMQAIGERHGGGVGYRVIKRQQDLLGSRRSDVADQTPVSE